MSTLPSDRRARLRLLIATFLQERLNGKLEKLTADDPKRAELRLQFEPTVWLEDAARRVGQIQAVTHSLKPIHPEAKGSSLYRDPGSLPQLDDVGSHVLADGFDADVVGNAAALDVYKFLKLSLDGQSLLQLAEREDADLAAAMSSDSTTASAWMAAFAGLAQPRGGLRSHTLAKQIYWPVSDDPHDDGAFHLLAPLYPTSLVHRVYQRLQDDRFGDEAKAARAARKAELWHGREVREYPNLAIQSLGGTKPQNISQLNSERRGDSPLLACVPPVWRSAEVRPVLGVDSLFKTFRRRREAQRLTDLLRRLLQSDPANNVQTRRQRDQWVGALLDEFVQFTEEQRTLPPGWTSDARCELPATHCRWLEPVGAETAGADVFDDIAKDFALWLNVELRTLGVGDPEQAHWQQQAREVFEALAREDAW